MRKLDPRLEKINDILWAQARVTPNGVVEFVAYEDPERVVLRLKEAISDMEASNDMERSQERPADR